MDQIKKIFKSRQVWTIVALFAVSGVSGIHDQIPANYLPIIDAVLGLLAVYFRIAPKQNFHE